VWPQWQGVGAVIGGDRVTERRGGAGAAGRTPRRGGRAVIAVVPEIRMVVTVGTTPTQDMELSADDVIYRINTLITR
jgi:hypothetical protein